MNDLLFISWAPFCSRSDNIARELGGRSVLIYHAFWGSNYATVLFKYLSQTLATFLLLLRMRPRRTFVMSPPAIACPPVWIYAKLFRAVYVVDAHAEVFVDARWRAFEFLTPFFARRAITTLVTQGLCYQLPARLKRAGNVLPLIYSSTLYARESAFVGATSALEPHNLSSRSCDGLIGLGCLGS